MRFFPCFDDVREAIRDLLHLRGTYTHVRTYVVPVNRGRLRDSISSPSDWGGGIFTHDKRRSFLCISMIYGISRLNLGIQSP